MSFPITRLRRLRQSEAVRKMVRETELSAGSLIWPLFVRPGKNQKRPIASLPGQFQLSVDGIVKEAKEAFRLGVPAVILFGIPEKKDARGSDAFSRDGIVQRAVREIKAKVPGLVVITDLCFCEYTDHGHCGVLRRAGKNQALLDNDATLDLIAQTALVQAEAGADVIAPSGMMDGSVRTIRAALDKNGFENKIILAYAAKYASAFYGPFRDAAESKPAFSDRKSYQMDPANAAEALREVGLDLEEGADIVMVKPALAYLDVVRRVKDAFHAPVAAYNVSGEYAMVKAAGGNGWINETAVTLEILTAIRRAGADFILTYHAKEVAKILND